MIKYKEYEIKISDCNFSENVAILKLDDGSIICIPEDGATTEEFEIIKAIKNDVESRPVVVDIYAINDAKIAELKKLLSDTDYVAIKIAEGSATIEEYAEVIAQRKLWREEINSLEAN